jgi:hypothetical protein
VVVGIKQNFDFNGLYDIPVLELCNPDKRQIGILTNVKNLKLSLRYNNVSEMSFTVYAKINDVDYPYYDLVRKMRLIHVENMGYFVISEVNEHFEYDIPYKEVSCYSAEYMLNY